MQLLSQPAVTAAYDDHSTGSKTSCNISGVDSKHWGTALMESFHDETLGQYHCRTRTSEAASRSTCSMWAYGKHIQGTAANLMQHDTSDRFSQCGSPAVVLPVALPAACTSHLQSQAPAHSLATLCHTVPGTRATLCDTQTSSGCRSVRQPPSPTTTPLHSGQNSNHSLLTPQQICSLTIERSHAHVNALQSTFSGATFPVGWSAILKTCSALLAC